MDNAVFRVMASTGSSDNSGGGPKAVFQGASITSSTPAAQPSPYKSVPDSDKSSKNIRATNADLGARSDDLGSSDFNNLNLKSDTAYPPTRHSYPHVSPTFDGFIQNTPPHKTSTATENLLPPHQARQASPATLRKRKFASSSLSARRPQTRPKLADFNLLHAIGESHENGDSDSIPSSPPTFNTQNLELDITRANEFDASPAYNCSPPLLPPNKTNFEHSDMSYSTKMLSDAELEAQIDHVTEQTGSIGLHPSPAGNDLPGGGDAINSDNEYRRVSKKDQLTGGLLRRDADDDDQEEITLPNLPSSRPAPALPAEEEDNHEDLTLEDINNHFLDLIAPMYDLLYQCKTEKEADNVRKAAVRKLLVAHKEVLNRAWYYDRGKLPKPQTDSFLQYEMKLFAAKPMCPWGFIRNLIHSPKFRHTIHAFEKLLMQLVDDVNACIPKVDRRIYGLDKDAFLSAISKALCLNMVPGLHLSDATIPNLEQKLELVDSFYDPVCLFEHSDEDKAPESGAARRKYRDFAFIEKVAAMNIANHNADWARTAGAVDPDIEKDGMPYFFTTDSTDGVTYIHRILLSEPSLSNEVKEFFAGEGFRVLVNTFEESCINAFVLRLKDIGATCRKKVLVLVVAEHIVSNFGVAKDYEVAMEVEGSGTAGSVGAVVDNAVYYDEDGVAYDQTGVRVDAPGDQELDDAISEVVGIAYKGSVEEMDGDGDSTMI